MGGTGKELAGEEAGTETLQNTVGLAAVEQSGGEVSECGPSHNVKEVTRTRGDLKEWCPGPGIQNKALCLAEATTHEPCAKSLAVCLFVCLLSALISTSVLPGRYVYFWKLRHREVRQFA